MFRSLKNLGASSTEIKVKQLTSDSESNGSTMTSSLMNEISILTYSSKTLREITQVLRKRLQLITNLMNQPIPTSQLPNSLRKQQQLKHQRNENENINAVYMSITGNSVLKKYCIQILKTLTLIGYLINNGSNEFIEWGKHSCYIMEPLCDIEVIHNGNHIASPNSSSFSSSSFFHSNNSNGTEGIASSTHDNDNMLLLQIRRLAVQLVTILNDDALLEKRRHDLIEFRSSISTPGKKSTDNSHLKRTFEFDKNSKNTSLDSSSNEHQPYRQHQTQQQYFKSKSLDSPRVNNEEADANNLDNINGSYNRIGNGWGLKKLTKGNIMNRNNSTNSDITIKDDKRVNLNSFNNLKTWKFSDSSTGDAIKEDIEKNNDNTDTNSNTNNTYYLKTSCMSTATNNGQNNNITNTPPKGKYDRFNALDTLDEDEENDCDDFTSSTTTTTDDKSLNTIKNTLSSFTKSLDFEMLSNCTNENDTNMKPIINKEKNFSSNNPFI
ncbi:uncharacterized protein SCODWIG_03116 [Saccharomycodes ludwigii]|uniref:ENTH domain-containing protein n=1 Tax=Saccharomycodes ludwigii TaxID=36035 RepID=A0A376B9J7_9ASCO|nr:uncharacterized protein SCODWIG_03116 [Saccharomycodes ludwigii]